MKKLLEQLLTMLPTLTLADAVRERIAASTRTLLGDEVLLTLARDYYDRMYAEGTPMRSDVAEWTEPGADAVLGENMLFTIIQLARACELNAAGAYEYGDGVKVDFLHETLHHLNNWIGRHDCLGLGSPTRHTIYRFIKPRIFGLGRLEFELTEHFFDYEVWRERTTGKHLPLIDDGVRFEENGFPWHGGKLSTARQETDTQVTGYTYLPDGRLDPTPVTLDKSRYERCLTRGDAVLSVHIPVGGRLDADAAEESFGYVGSFMANYFPEVDYKAFVCSSWLLDTNLRHFVGPESNMLKFQNRFTVGLSHRNGFSVYDDIFQVPKHCPLEELVPTNRFQREILAMLKAGGTLYSGRGYILTDR